MEIGKLGHEEIDMGTKTGNRVHIGKDMGA